LIRSADAYMTHITRDAWKLERQSNGEQASYAAHYEGVKDFHEPELLLNLAPIRRSKSCNPSAPAEYLHRV